MDDEEKGGEREVSWMMKATKMRHTHITTTQHRNKKERQRKEGRKQAHRKILKSSSISESPGKSGSLLSISAKMQPMDQASTGVE